ncbi:MAG: S-layer homology domain-containing protein [Clostridiales bacterium]|nr:S-layer homology domain-containing protein [Clostridiales bacterium]
MKLKTNPRSVVALLLTVCLLLGQFSLPAGAFAKPLAQGVSPQDLSTIIAAEDQNATPWLDGSYDVTIPHIIINQFYGSKVDSTTPVSHNFVELYNPTATDVDLAGWNLYYGTNGSGDTNGQQNGDWFNISLAGSIKAHTSYLVRLNATTSGDTLRLNLADEAWGAGWTADLDDEIPAHLLNNKGVAWVLFSGTCDLTKGENPWNGGNPAAYYVDMLAAGGNDTGTNDLIFAYEGNFTGSQSKQKAIRRIEFLDTDHNATEDDTYDPFADTQIIGYNVGTLDNPLIGWARPRCQADGVWAPGNLQDPMPQPAVTTTLSKTEPNCLTNIAGNDSQTSRIITWQMPASITAGTVSYGTAADDLDSTVTAAITPNYEGDPELGTESPTVYTNTMRATISGLTAGNTYYYQIGASSEIYSFTTDDGGAFSFAHVSDTQATAEANYKNVWGPAVEKITSTYTDLAFLLETGDLIDTKNSEDEWRWFMESARDVFGNYGFFPVIGNHEQGPKYDALSFRQHFTVPNPAVDGNITPDTTYSFDYGCAHFVILNSQSLNNPGQIAAQQAWLENDLQNNNQPWIIAGIHRGLFGQGGKSDTYDAFWPILSKYRADLILQGHDHIYMRTYPQEDDGHGNARNAGAGVISLESGGSGAKQDLSLSEQDYTEVSTAANNPSYSIINVSPEKISVETVYVDFNDKKDRNIYPVTADGESVDFEILAPAQADTLTLTPGADTGKINFTWYADTAAGDKSVVKIGPAATFPEGAVEVSGTSGAASSGKLWHKISVSSLTANTSYKYCVSNDGSLFGEVYSYKTPKAESFKFAVTGDPQLTTGLQDSTSSRKDESTAKGWQDTVAAIAARGVDFIAGVGDQVDLTNNGSEAEYTNFFAPDALRSLPFSPAVGNHDRHYLFNYHYNLPNEQSFTPVVNAGNASNEQYKTMEVAGNYYYLYNNALFVVLNDSGYPESKEVAAKYISLFDETLQAATTAHAGQYTWLFVQHHKSTASVADHIADTDIQYYVEAGFEKLMDEYSVDFVLAGHDHVYARSYPMLDGVLDKTGASGTVNATLTKGGDGASTATNPNGTVYFTTTTGSGLKYYELFNNAGNLYVKTNSAYPYLVEDLFGSLAYAGANIINNNPSVTGGTTDPALFSHEVGKLPLSTAKYLQNKTPGYLYIEVGGNTASFKYYDIGEYKDTPYDTYTVSKSAPAAEISLDKTGTHTFTGATVGYAALTPLTVTVTNSGGAALTNLAVNVSGENFNAGNPVTTALNPAATTTFTVVPKTGLAAGTYTATVTVTAASVPAKTFGVSFTVSSANPGDDSKPKDTIIPVVTGGGGGGGYYDVSSIFTDVAGHWALNAIGFVYGRNIFKGISSNQFAPNSPMTRSMFATVLHRIAGEPVFSGGSSFTDVPANTWYSQAVAWAADKKVVTGRSASIFDPNSTITREEMVTMLLRYATAMGLSTSQSGSLASLKDNERISAWAKEAVTWALDNEIIQGRTDGSFDPAGKATRAEVATIIQRFLEKYRI